MDNNNLESGFGGAKRLLLDQIEQNVDKIRANDLIEFTQGDRDYIAELIAKISETDDLNEQTGYAAEALTYLGRLLNEQ